MYQTDTLIRYLSYLDPFVIHSYSQNVFPYKNILIINTFIKEFTHTPFRSQTTEDLMVEIAQDREQVDKVRAVVKREQEVTDFETRKVESVAYEAQKDLSAALPQLEAATAALDTLSMFQICLKLDK